MGRAKAEFVAAGSRLCKRNVKICECDVKIHKIIVILP